MIPLGRPRPLGRLTPVGVRLRTAFGLAWQARRLVLIGYLGVQLASGALPVATTWLTKVTLDRLTRGSGTAGVVLTGVVLAAAAFGLAVLAPLARYLQSELGRSVAVLAKDRLYRAVTRLPQLDKLETPSFRDRLRLAEQASRTGPGQVLESGLGMAKVTVTLAGMVATVVVIAPLVAVALLASAGPALVAETQLSRRRATMLWRISPAERREIFYAELLTSLSAAKETRLFGTGRLFHRRMLAELADSNAERRRYDRRDVATQGLLAVASAALSGGALIWVLVATARGQVSVGGVAAVMVAINSVQSSLAAGVGHVAAVHHAGLLLDHYRALVQLTPDRPAADSMPAAGSAVRGIEFVDVWFRYGNGPWVLRGVSFAIPEGQAVALVGQNGSGKSTLVKLLCRFYDPTRGSIRWHGVDIREIPIEQLRRRIGAVFQDFMSYELTAAENIAVGGVDGRDGLDLGAARIVDAAEQAGVHDVLDALPHGYQTLLSRTFVNYAGDEADGVLLSGGQWQRLALARALLRGGRELLILDEPSSGLDAEAEYRVHHQIAEHRRGRTSVLISHRLSTVRDADQILVLAEGRLVEQGSHEQLLAAGRTYSRLFQLQAAGYQPAQAATP